jgi:glycerate kinase
MSRRVLIVPDKFKGTLTAEAAARLIGEGWGEVFPDDVLDLLPMSDGGDGFGEVLARLVEVQVRTTATVDAAHRPCAATWWRNEEEQTAIVESARVIGLALLPPHQFHPFELDTCGLGKVLQEAAAGHCRQCWVGIGGSATNDGGFGMARAVGWKFTDAVGQRITRWTDLTRLARIERPERQASPVPVVVAVDVQNPFLGPTGASRVYGPQKGLQPDDFPLAEACLERLAERVQLDLGVAADVPGDGAAGGLGFGFRAFFNARLESGFSLFARIARLEERIRSADLVITGEGAIDPSTAMGKGVGEVARLCRAQRVPCLGLAGTVLGGSDGRLESEFTALHGIVPELARAEAACASPETWLPRLARQVAVRQKSAYGRDAGSA